MRHLPTVSPTRIVTATSAGILVLFAALLAVSQGDRTAWPSLALLGLVAVVGLLQLAPWLGAGMGLVSGVIYAWWPHSLAGAPPAAPAVFAAALLIGVGLLIELGGRQLMRAERAAALGRRYVARPESQDRLSGPVEGGNPGRTLLVELARARRYHFSVTFGLLEIVDWRQLVEQHGRQRMLESVGEFGRRFRASLRAEDEFSYLGSGRFALVLPQTDAASARVAAERARRLCRDAGLTLRAGLAEFPDDAETEEALVSEAEAALEAETSEWLVEDSRLGTLSGGQPVGSTT